MRLQARWTAAASRPAAAAAAAAAAATASLPPSSFASGSGLLLHRKAQQRRIGRQLGLVTEARDGKKRRKPQQSGSRDGSSSSDEELLASARAPYRVDPTNGVNVKFQIKWAKACQESRRQAGQSFRQRNPPRAFRQDSLDPEEHRRQREEQERIAEEARKRQSDMVTLQQMFGTVVASPSEQPLGVTLIDGYNLLYRWAERRSGVAEWIELARANTPGMLHEAREWLLQQLDLYSHMRGMYIHVVYDAMNVGYSSQYNVNGMKVDFAGKDTADTIILQKAREYCERGIQKVCIVSDDMEVALLGPDVETRFPGQAVFSSSCGALIQLVEDGQAEALREVELMGAVSTSNLDTPFFNLPSTKARSAVHNGVARRHGGNSSNGSGGDGSSVRGLRGIGGLAGLRTQLHEQEVAQERERQQQRREQQRQERERQRQERLRQLQAQQEQQAQQGQQEQQPEG